MDMNSGWTRINFEDVTDLAVQYGMQEMGEARYLGKEVGAERTGLSLYRMRAGQRPGFGHRHEAVEEMYVVLSGSGRVKIDDEIVDLRRWDVVRVAPACVREFEAGPDGMELLATGAHVDGDGEMIQGWWPAEP